MGMEQTVEVPVTNLAKTAGFLVRKLQWIGRRGAPDRLFSHPIHGTFLVEFKAPGKEPTAQQFREIKRLRDSGIDAVWFDDVQAALEYMGIA